LHTAWGWSQLQLSAISRQEERAYAIVKRNLEEQLRETFLILIAES
jgi:hypothetical protein